MGIHKYNFHFFCVICHEVVICLGGSSLTHPMRSGKLCPPPCVTSTSSLSDTFHRLKNAPIFSLPLHLTVRFNAAW